MLAGLLCVVSAATDSESIAFPTKDVGDPKAISSSSMLPTVRDGNQTASEAADDEDGDEDCDDEVDEGEEEVEPEVQVQSINEPKCKASAFQYLSEGKCVCMRGFELVDDVCKKLCKYGFKRNSKGTCVCPARSEQVDDKCLPKCRVYEKRVGVKCVKACKKYQIWAPKADGKDHACVCKPGYKKFGENACKLLPKCGTCGSANTDNLHYWGKCRPDSRKCKTGMKCHPSSGGKFECLTDASFKELNKKTCGTCGFNAGGTCKPYHGWCQHGYQCVSTKVNKQGGYFCKLLPPAEIKSCGKCGVPNKLRTACKPVTAASISWTQEKLDKYFCKSRNLGTVMRICTGLRKYISTKWA